MKTILLAIGSSEIGGGQKVFLTCIKEFLKRKYEIIVALPDGPLYQLLRSFEVELHTIDYNSVKSLYLILKLLKRGNIDIINTYLTKCSLLFSFVNIVYRVPICCTLLNAVTHEKLNKIQKLIYPLFYFFLQKICDGIVVNSEQNRNHFVEAAGMKADAIKVIYSGIDADDFHRGLAETTKRSKFIIGTVGRLSIEKGQTYLIDALAQLKDIDIDYECLMIGDGPLRAELETKVKKNELETKVSFLGFQMDIAAFMQLMDVVVVPSLNETFGIVIIEAFAMKKIVIASDAGGIPELVINNKTGLLFPVRDSSALAERILYVYNNKEEAQMMAMNAYAYFKKNFTGSIMAEKTIQYYDSIVKAHSH